MNKNILLDIIGNYNEGGEFTSIEILRQPNLWPEVYKSVSKKATEISEFISQAKQNSDLHVILTGAGTSAFIGDALEGIFQFNTGLITKAIPTTDLVTHPELFFSKDKDILLISFARSGDSPESAKTVELAQQLSHKALNLVITCNEKSNLINSLKNTRSLILLLPSDADDKSLAMTSSFSSMLLTGILVSNVDSISDKEKDVGILSQYGENIFKNYLSALKNVSELDFERAIFLGSGSMRGIARESQLKLQELTDGKIISKYDSFLGFRHGPKAVINEKTLITYLFSNDNYVNNYEIDFVNAISQGRKPLYSIGVMENEIKGINLDLKIILGNGKDKLAEEFLAVVSVLPAQILGFLKSIQLELKPDNPSESGMIHRVVQGVNVYPYTKNGNK